MSTKHSVETTPAALLRKAQEHEQMAERLLEQGCDATERLEMAKALRKKVAELAAGSIISAIERHAKRSRRGDA